MTEITSTLQSTARLANVSTTTSPPPHATEQPKQVTSAATASTRDPYTHYDPMVGIITTYLNSQGQVSAQFPSTTVVAYLRAGLTAEGTSKSDSVSQTL